MNKKTIWITGGSTGIGKALAIKFSYEGWNVAISARRENLLKEISDQYEKISSFPSTDIDLISIPTTAGTGSELTCWATIWDEENQRKHSLIHQSLFSKLSIFDSELTLSLPKKITIETSLDAMSHSFESIWNINSNPVSNIHARNSINIILKNLPLLVKDLKNIKLRNNESINVRRISFFEYKNSNISFDFISYNFKI